MESVAESSEAPSYPAPLELEEVSLPAALLDPEPSMASLQASALAA